MVLTAMDKRFDSPDKYCFQCPIAVDMRPDSFIIRANLFYSNQWLAPCNNNRDLSLQEFLDLLWSEHAGLPLQWYSGYSEFIQRYYSYIPK